MSAPILATKLYVPPLRPKVVRRPRLIEGLNEGLRSGRKLTLISAPAGFGKTTLLGEWLAGGERPAAWLSLDEGDNDLTRFLTYIVSAMQTVASGLGAGVLALLQSPQSAPAEWILTALINEVAALPRAFILVLDDYHVIEVQPIHDALAFLIDRLPPQMHVAVASRADPPLPLARLRARGELTELRAADLRFTPDEAATFLNQVMGLGLSAEQLTALEDRTEGWIAGLQMAALSMRGQADSASFIQAFTGSHRFVLDYLVEEVLQGQPEPIRSFLLQTAILDRLSGPLCDAVTGRADGRDMLEALERSNMFVVPLDDQRRWYRYHHLFADVLRARLMQAQPAQVSPLHQRASDWYEHNDFPSDAIRHALAAADFERAAGLVERIWPAIRRRRQEATLLGWVKALPDNLIRARPVLGVVSAWALLDGGELEAAEARLLEAERWLGTAEGAETPVTEMVVVDENQFRALPASIANARAYRAQALGDVPGTVTYAQQALEQLPEDDYYERGTTAALLGLAHWASGNLEAAHDSFTQGLADLQKGGALHSLGATFILAEIRLAQGRLREALLTYEQAFKLATAQSEAGLPGTAELHLGLSELSLEQGDLEAAQQHLRTGEALRPTASLPGNEYRWRVAQARLHEVQGDLDGALASLQQAERLYYRSPIPDVHPIAAMKARVWLAAGRLPEALAWVRERGLSVGDNLSYLREYEHITLARVLLARYANDRAEHLIQEAVGLLERLLQAADEGERTGSVIEILALQGLAHQARGDLAAALGSLKRALTLAEPEGYVRLFVVEGPPMAALLGRMKDAPSGQGPEGISPVSVSGGRAMEFSPLAIADRFGEGERMKEYIAKLLAAFRGLESLHPSSPSPQPLVEPLSDRERDVLRLLGTDLTGSEIARELVVSLTTVRTHTQNIYRKLEVNNRRAAVRRAEELGLL